MDQKRAYDDIVQERIKILAEMKKLEKMKVFQDIYNYMIEIVN